MYLEVCIVKEHVTIWVNIHMNYLSCRLRHADVRLIKCKVNLTSFSREPKRNENINRLIVWSEINVSVDVNRLVLSAIWGQKLLKLNLYLSLELSILHGWNIQCVYLALASSLNWFCPSPHLDFFPRINWLDLIRHLF